MIKRINHIWNRTLAHRSEVFCIYLCQLILGLLIGFFIFGIFNDNLGQSMALEHLTSGFDRTVIMDMINSNENVFSLVSFWTAIILPLYLILSTVLQGGLLYNISKGETGIKSQLNNGIRYLLPFLGVVLLSILLIILFAVLIGLPFKTFVGDPLLTFSSEKPFVLSLLLLIAIFSACAITVWGFSIISRYNYINGSSFWASTKSGFLFVKKHFLKILLVGYLLIGIHFLLALIYYLIMGDQGTSSWLIVILGIIIQQVFSFARVLIRSFGYVAIDQIEDNYIG